MPPPGSEPARAEAERQPPARQSSAQADGPAPTLESAGAALGNAALSKLFGPQPADGSFLINLGPAPGLRIGADELGLARIDLADRARPLPGLLLKAATYNPRDRKRRVSITGALEIPHVRDNEFTIDVSEEGRPTIDVRARTALPMLGNPELRVRMEEDNSLAGSIAFEQMDLVPAGLGRNLTATGSGSIALAAGKLSGNVHADLAYPKLGGGAFDLAFSETGRLSGSGHIALTTGFLGGVRAELSVNESGSLTAAADIPAASLATAVPGLTIPSGTVHLDYADGVVSGAITALKLAYPGLGSADIDARIAASGQIEGNGAFDLSIAGFADARGSWAYRTGVFGGTVTIAARHFPSALPVRSGEITATLDPTGEAEFRGQVGVTLGPAGAGELRAAYSTDAKAVMIGASVNLTVPGLQGASFTVNYLDGALEGEGQVPVDTALLPGVTGTVHVVYRDGMWSGDTELAYSADNGKLAGAVRVQVNQTEAGALQVTGGGEVTAHIAPRLQGKLMATILPAGGVDVSGKITVTEPLELFPEWRADKELFRYSQNIPLWAILVAVIRVRAGVRAGVGPGVFRNITVEGSYTVGQEGEPSFSISGEMFIPAFVEAYVAFGAGLGLDVVLGSLTGGIEGTAAAGLYGAISVIPQLSYDQGDYKIDGTATLAAGARLKLGLNAWAEIEALWVTVWENSWALGEWVWNVGPDLGLQAHMAYNFSNPGPPTVDFTSSDIDTDAMIQAAMPKDGPGPSGAKEALQNKAEWKGQLQAQRAAAALPPALAAKGSAAPPAPPAPAKPPAKVKPPAEANGKGSPEQAAAAAGPAPNPAPTPGQAESGAVKAAATKPATPEKALKPEEAPPDTGQPRYPRAVSLSTLDEPPALVPRTPAQQEEDLDKARTLVRLTEEKVEDTAALESYFPRIKRRFQLSAIRLVASGAGGVCVRLDINPTAMEPVVELAKGDDLAGVDSLMLKTRIKYEEATLAKHPVGTKMVATILGPDHEAGSEPTQQKALLDLLPTQRGSEVGNYIRGHLLNDNVGGPGVSKNLYPITQRANRLHLQYMERTIKTWVNDKRYWVFYSVAITNMSDNLSDPATTLDTAFASATIVTEAAVLNVDQSPSTKLAERGVTIRSDAMIKAKDTDVTLRKGPAFTPVGAEQSPGQAPTLGKDASGAPIQGPIQYQNAPIVEIQTKGGDYAKKKSGEILADEKLSASDDLGTHKARDQDDALTIQASKRHDPTGAKIDDTIVQAVESGTGVRGRLKEHFAWGPVAAAIQSVPNLGPVTAALLVACLKDPNQLHDLDENKRGLITKANNLAAAIILKLNEIQPPAATQQTGSN